MVASCALEALEGKTVALLGQSKNFSFEELEQLLSLDAITLERAVSPQTALIVAGRLLNPTLQADIDRVELEQTLPVIGIDAFEQSVARFIHQEGLKLSLKLSNDPARLLSYLRNELLSDAVFISLLPLFSWQGETLFGNDENRDVCAAVTRRFYDKVAFNHNVEYSPVGIYETTKTTQNGALLDTLARLEVLKQGFGAHPKTIEYQILEALCTNDATPASTLKYIVSCDTSHRFYPLLAMAKALSSTVITQLLKTKDVQTLANLGTNPRLDANLKITLLQERDIAPFIAQYAPMHASLFDAILSNHTALLPELASNETLDSAMIEALFSKNLPLIHKALAANPATPQPLLARLSDDADHHVALACNPALKGATMQLLCAQNNDAVQTALAANPATPKAHLEQLSHHPETSVVAAVAANPSTPVAVLYALHLDMQFERAVKTNPAFGQAIKQEIGWGDL